MPGVPFLTAQLGALARLIVEAAWGADLTAPSTSWAWFDITADVRQADGQKITITQGRSDEASQAQPASCAFQIDNTSGNYSPYNPIGNRYPNVRRNTPIRVSVDLGTGAGPQVRFFGFANGFTPSWDKSAKLAVVSVSASGVLRRLQQGRSPIQSPIRRAIIAANPVGYWPLEDKAGAVQVGSGIAGGSPATVSGTVKFAADTTLIGSQTAATLTATSSLSGSVTHTFGGHWQVDWYTKIPAIPTSETVVMQVFTTGTMAVWKVSMVKTTNVYTAVRGYGTNGALVYDSGLILSVNSLPVGQWLNLQFTVNQNGSNIDWEINTNQVTGAPFFYKDSVAGTVGNVTGWQIPADAGLDGVSVSHIAVWDAFFFNAVSAAARGYGPNQTLGTLGEPPAVRIARLCAEEGIPLSGVVAEDFEDATLIYTITGTWARDNTQSHSGTWSLKSAAIGNNAQTDAVVTVPSGFRTLSFWFKVSSEIGFDFFKILLNGVVQPAGRSGEDGWTQLNLDVTGISQVTFRYEKDPATIGGLDAVWIDDLIFVNSPVTMGPQSIDTFVNLMRESEAADGGVLYDGFNAGLGFIANSARYSQPAALTLDMAAGQVAHPFAPVDDDQRNRNLVKVDRKNGSSATFEDTDGPLGTKAIGTYDTSLTLNVATDVGLLDRAAWEVHKGTVEGLRYPNINMDLAASPGLVPAWLATTLNERIDVTNVTSKALQHPSDTVSLLLEGYSESLSPFGWTVSGNCSPYAPWRVAVVGQTRVDSAGTTVRATVSAGASSVQVDVVGALWTTKPASFPLDLSIDGIRVTVTAITGAASPQTLTVNPATVTKQLTAGRRVRLWQPAVVAL